MPMNTKLLAQFGLKWNPFATELPLEALYPLEHTASFLWRIEHALVREGGFALITGEPGTGKSVLLRRLAAQLGQLPDVTVGVLTHPQGKLGDFYRELAGPPVRRYLQCNALAAQPLERLQGTAPTLAAAPRTHAAARGVADR